MNENIYSGIATDEEIALMERDRCPCVACIDKARLINRLRATEDALTEREAESIPRTVLRAASAELREANAEIRRLIEVRDDGEALHFDLENFDADRNQVRRLRDALTEWLGEKSIRVESEHVTYYVFADKETL